jgi:hypothetical protein
LYRNEVISPLYRISLLTLHKIALALLLAALSQLPVRAQLFQVQGGTSTMYHAQGGTLSFKAGNLEGGLSGGVQDGSVRLGAFLRTEWRGYDVSMGDNTLRFELPTDVFDASHFVQSRGVGITRKFGRLKIGTFGGVSSSRFGPTFFQGGIADEPIGAFNLDFSISEKTTLFSRNLFSHKQTFIDGISYHPRSWLATSIAAGSGGGDPYFAAALTAERTWISTQAEYVQMGEHFRRLMTPGPQGQSSEVDRENVQVTLRPTTFVFFGASRQNLAQPADDSPDVYHATVNSFFAGGQLAGFDIRGALYTSEVEGKSMTGVSLNAGRKLTNRIETALGVYQSRPEQLRHTTTANFTVREIVNARFGVSQTLNRSGNQTNFQFGGDFSSNRLTLGVNYQTVFVPFLQTSAFRQALAFNVRLRTFRNMEFGANSYVAPDGRVRYTFTLGTTLVRYGSMSRGQQANGIGKYVVQGFAVDENGRPVAGLAFHIDGVTVYTDVDGRFSVRFAKRRTYPFSYSQDESISAEQYDIVSAPSEVRGEAEGKAEDIKVEMRSMRQMSHRTEFRKISQTR